MIALASPAPPFPTGVAGQRSKGLWQTDWSNLPLPDRRRIAFDSSGAPKFFDKSYVESLDAAPLYDMVFVERGVMNIRDLATQTGTTERQIRYLIAEGFLPPPSGGRSTAVYGEDHLAGIQRYTRLRDLGFPPAAIRLLLETREGAPFPVAPGVTLVVDPSLVGSSGDVAPIIDRLEQLLGDIFREAAADDETSKRDD